MISKFARKPGKPIRIGLIGSGEMGTDIVTRVAHMSGIEIGAISELNVPAATKAVDIAYREGGAFPRSSNGLRHERRDGSRQDRRDQRRAIWSSTTT